MEHPIILFLGEHLEALGTLFLSILAMLFLKLPAQRNINFKVIVEGYENIIQGQKSRIIFLEEQEKIRAEFEEEIVKRVRAAELREVKLLTKTE